ncbi:phenylalanine--tRNA ligase subunit alpha [Candidatus Woesearchaeota archaeon]|jgi:phenylalanyl-tRNA synthetase alpha chain|nr:phenylalanine--tRNA ligase subunit alpha [Candidatus Woesearchaeota archaeon]MBT5273030.1 phenylalanine--tRNA ligase subunit alpha [Candidatus Woesearchaeota archaeon]MBT6040834.1 phenylalanine--tRNA ligase subunit alpha [Candidatus Woesearchaeota archaeon]MBT6337655.1 phenylalanine--tRNA ligase subunit alpha [Candidatus Woesearchaeota archaeon]MBT7926944.1 phenylalanine--tRNA ligase subunit alpha [Candidatus Woesearchaeota archaeon]
MDIKKVIEGLHPLERKVLPVLVKHSSLNKIVEKTKLPLAGVMRAFQWLQNKEIVKLKEDVKDVIQLDKTGKDAAKNGLPEKRFIKAIKEKAMKLNEIAKKAKLEKDEVNACIGILKRKAAIEIKRDGKEMIISITGPGKKLLDQESLEEKFLTKLSKNSLELDKLEDEDKFALDNFKKRKTFILVQNIKTFSAELTEKGKKIVKSGIKDVKVVDRLTHEMLKTGKWKGQTFRRYDVKINVPQISGGKRHFVNQAIEYARRIWLDMGFKEMTGPMLTTSFWNFDALFTAQDHPVRELQDTYYIQNPEKGDLPKQSTQTNTKRSKNYKIVEQVKNVHENGGTTGSQGWRYKWNEEDAKRNVLRTHTTCLSAKTLASLKESDLPAKYFSVGKCFRNETLDWSHLFEFNQTEGIVIDKDANLKHLMGYLREFAKKMGFPKVRFRPAYFPYTEPSLEGDVYDPIHGKWIEFIAAGIFRPEVVKPLLGVDVPVLAWGPGLDRMITSAYKIKDIRDLYRNDLKQLKNMKAWMRL